MFKSKLWIFLCLLFLCSSGPAAFCEEENLPMADELFARYIKETGGKETYDKIENRMAESVLDLQAQGIKMTFKVWSAKPNLIYTIVESDMMGKMESGCNGDVVWENSMMTGPNVKEGKERHDTMILSTFDRFVYWKDSYKKAECEGKEDVKGAACYKVVLYPKDYTLSEEDDAEQEPPPHVVFFNAETGLIDRYDLTVNGPMGSMTIQSYLKDYKKVDDILVAHEVTMSVMGMDRILTTQSIEQNIEMPENRFKLPEEIQKLVDGKKAEEAVETEG